MLRPFGRDRIISSSAEEIVLASPILKDWTPRHQRRIGGHPGTTVAWNDEHFEVIEATQVGAGFRYTLRPWPDAEIIRRLLTYSEESERALHLEAARQRRLSRHRIAINALMPLYGLLPSDVQMMIEHRIGVLSSTQTLVSALFFLVAGGSGVTVTILGALDDTAIQLPLLLQLGSAYALLESMVRCALALGQTRPFGSLITEIPWALYSAATRRPPPLDPVIPPTDIVARADRFRLVEPVAALLPVKDQESLAVSFGFDPILWGKRTAMVLIVAATAGVYSSVATLLNRSGSAITLASLLIASVIVAEQVIRLLALFSNRPAASGLGLLVRPFARPLLSPPNAPPLPTPDDSNGDANEE